MRFRYRGRNQSPGSGIPSQCQARSVPQSLASHLRFEADTGLLEIARTTAQASFPEWTPADREKLAHEAARAATGHLEMERQVDAMEAVFVAAEFDIIEDRIDGSDESLVELGRMIEDSIKHEREACAQIAENNGDLRVAQAIRERLG